MRGARVAAAFLAAIPVVTTAMLYMLPPQGRRYVPIRFEWGWGLYATWAIGVAALLVAIRFGGRIDDIKVSRGRVAGSGETLH